jgi:L-amino acid N-acyltransferase YncA
LYQRIVSSSGSANDGQLVRSVDAMEVGMGAVERNATVTVRDAGEADLAATLDIYNELIPSTTIAWTEELQTIEARRVWFAEPRRREFPVLVAAIDAENREWIAFHERLRSIEVARMPEVGFKFGRRLDLVLLPRLVPSARAQHPRG